MNLKSFKIVRFFLTLVILSSMLGAASPVSAATNNVWGWGNNAYGQLGYSLVLFGSEPVQVSGLTGVAAIAATRHSLALQSPDAPSTVGSSPAAGAMNVQNNTVISWITVPFANYDFQLSTSANFTTLTANVSNSLNNTYTPPVRLTNNTTYYWRVRSRLMTITSAWVTSSFTTVSPAIPTSPPIPTPAQLAEPSTSATCTIGASAGANGSITPFGSVVVNSGGSRTFSITANADCKIADVVVDGASVGAVTSYTFDNISANHTISAIFAVQNPSSSTPWVTIIAVIITAVLATGITLLTVASVRKKPVG